MIIKSVILKNIRSYLDEKINFPSGSVLLSGDIGSGKSTVLLGIEFVLFGFERKHLSGSTLLRNGEKEGSVEVNFEIDGKDVVIKRVLKRTKDSIKQEAGYIIIDKTKKELTPVELRAFVLNLLGYPKELLTKSKDIIYKYTVYTPQEEMKQILVEDKDVRLETLRKVFQIDKYKRIRENSVIFIREIKEMKREYEGIATNLDEKKQQLKEREHESEELGIKLDETTKIIIKIREENEKRKQNMLKYEKKIKLFDELKNNLERKELELQHKLENRKKNNNELTELDKKSEELEKELKNIDIGDIKEISGKMESKKNQIELMEKTISEIRNKINEFNINIKNADDIKRKISVVDKCPLCQQDVTERHKFEVTAEQNSKTKKSNDEIIIHSKQEKSALKKIEEIKTKFEELREKEKSFEILKLKRERLKEKLEKKESLLKFQDEIKKDIGKINVEKVETNEKLSELKNVEEEYEKLRKNFEEIKEKEKDKEIEEASMKKEMEGINNIIKSLQGDIGKMVIALEKSKRLSQLQNWLDEYFIKLMGLIEKHVMFRIHDEFNELFKSWFNMLIEDETINVRLDDEFTPVIEQNGYETEVDNLSGGEKTSCALAYRLALNKVVNDIVENIKTKDLIILDEPTDGFSGEQLDKIRDIVNQLDMKQIIIVSHEEKIESFVNNIIRINKNEHVSNVVVAH